MAWHGMACGSTVFESSDPESMMRRQSGMISVLNRKLITSESSICADIAARSNAQPRRSFKREAPDALPHCRYHDVSVPHMSVCIGAMQY
jgi:hypothetical protein